MSHPPHTTGRHLNISSQTSGTAIALAQAQANNGHSNANSPCPPTSILQNNKLPRMTSESHSLSRTTREPDRGTRTTHPQSPIVRRTTGLHSILNPPSDPTYHHSQNFSTSPRQHEYIGGHGISAPVLASPRIRKRGESSSPARDQETGHTTSRTGRRILTPKSPGLRAASFSTHKSPSLVPGKTSRATSGYNHSNTYSAEPGERQDSTIPPLPALPASHSSTSTMYAVGGSAGRAQGLPQGAGRTYVAGPVSASSTPHLPFASRASTSPSYQHSPSLALDSEVQVPKSEFSAGLPSGQGSSSRQGEHYTQSGWMLALEGGDVGVLVDNQQASKVADEKRKRNAGASARFRARRKEREKEASQTISGLQQELRELAEDKDFYINERNYFRELFARNNSGPLPPRPSSPQARRVHGVGSNGHESDFSSDYGRRETTELPEQIRSTVEYQSPFAVAPSNTTPYQAPYAPFTYNNQSPGSLTEARPALASAPQLPPPRAQIRDPFQRDILDRNWNIGK